MLDALDVARNADEIRAFRLKTFDGVGVDVYPDERFGNFVKSQM